MMWSGSNNIMSNNYEVRVGQPAGHSTETFPNECRAILQAKREWLKSRVDGIGATYIVIAKVVSGRTIWTRRVSSHGNLLPKGGKNER